MTQVQPSTNESVKSGSAVLHQQHFVQTPIDPFLQKLSVLELPAKAHFEGYMRHKWRLNHRERGQVYFLSTRKMRKEKGAFIQNGVSGTTLACRFYSKQVLHKRPV